MVRTGTPVYAAGPGVVEVAHRCSAPGCGPNNSGLGNSIAIRHDNGRYSWYGHLSEVYPAEQSRVVTGQLIGKSGSSGNATGPNLHYEEKATLWGPGTLPGSMFAYHGSKKVRYPEVLGRSRWDSLRCGRQSTEPGCTASHTVRNDGFSLEEATGKKGACVPRRMGVVFVLDDSGSNQNTDPRLLRADAARVALNYLPPGTLVSAVAFASSAYTMIDTTELTVRNREPIAQRIRAGLRSSGSTNYEAGFRHALTHLGRMQGTQQIVIFLSDGQPTSGYVTDRQIAAQGVQIHTVGYGPVRNLPVLIDIARRSGASYQPINNVAEASNAFATIVNPYQCNRPIDDDTHTLRPNRRWQTSFTVGKGLRGITAIATWTHQATPKLDLIRPDGTKLSDALYQGEGWRKQGLQVIRFDVTKPYPGKWTLVAISPDYVNLAFNVWRTQETPIALRAFKYVALGDSYSSGEGVDPYFRDGDVDPKTKKGSLDNRCHRSSRAYAAWVQPRVYDDPLYHIASGGGKPGSFGGANKYASDENVRHAGGVSWVFWACSGARIPNVRPGGTPQNSVKDGYREAFTQLDNRSVRGADLVTITIGGNDAGFADYLEQCAFMTSCQSLERSIELSIDAATSKLAKLFQEIRAKTEARRILVLGYPTPFAVDSGQCIEGTAFTLGERDMIRRLGNRLNWGIRDAAEDAKVEFVPVAKYFVGHEVCGKKEQWINGVRGAIPVRRGPLDPESFHPNEKGQRLGYAAAINDALQRGGP